MLQPLSVNTHVTNKTSSVTLTDDSQKSARSAQMPSFSVQPTTTVNISLEAEALYKQEQTETTLSKSELYAKYQRIEGASSPLLLVATQINAHGKNAKVLSEIPCNSSPERAAQAKKIADFVYAQHPFGKMAGDPYDALSRDELSNIIEDESGNHTVVERYAAYGTRQKKDDIYLSQVFNDNSVSGSVRFYQGLLDFYDAQSPVERSAYPDGHREKYQGFLKEAEQVTGKKRGPNLLEVLMEAYARKKDKSTLQGLPALVG